MRVMSAILSAIGEILVPRDDMEQIRFRVANLITLLVTAVMVLLAVGYQVFGRWARRSTRPD